MSDQQKKVSVMFVCMGNICRSTMAEAIFKHLAIINPDVPIGKIDSSGTDGYNLGSEPDSRTMDALADHKIGPYHHRAQLLQNDHFDEFDILVGMDQRNLNFMLSRSEYLKREKAKANGGQEGTKHAKVGLLGDFSSSGKREYIRDPYSIAGGFESTYVQVREYCENLLEAIRDGTWAERLEKV